jgi:GMP synthase-like glutamine amidotransferase
MKTALLVCDHVPDVLVAEHGTYPDMFRRILQIPFDSFYVCDGNFPVIENYDLFICTGSKYSVYDGFPWIYELIDLTRQVYQSGKTFVGVCYGHQVIAEALGGKVQRSEKGYLIGVHPFTILEEKPWMKPFEPEFSVLMLCQDQVVSLPENAELLASSESCKAGMFTAGNHFLGIQGHPEFTPEYNRALFESRLQNKDPEKVTRAVESLQQKTDSRKLAGYIHHFINRT